MFSCCLVLYLEISFTVHPILSFLFMLFIICYSKFVMLLTSHNTSLLQSLPLASSLVYSFHTRLFNIPGVLLSSLLASPCPMPPFQSKHFGAKKYLCLATLVHLCLYTVASAKTDSIVLKVYPPHTVPALFM